MKKVSKYVIAVFSLIIFLSLTIISCSSSGNQKEINNTALTDSMTNLFLNDGKVLEREINGQVVEKIFYVFPMHSFQYEKNDKIVSFINDYVIPKPEELTYDKQKNEVKRQDEIAKEIIKNLTNSDENYKKYKNFKVDFDKTPMDSLINRVVASSKSKYISVNKVKNEYEVKAYFEKNNKFYEINKNLSADEYEKNKEKLLELDSSEINEIDKSEKIVRSILSELKDLIKFNFSYSLNNQNINEYVNIFNIKVKDDVKSVITKIVEPSKNNKTTKFITKASEKENLKNFEDYNIDISSYEITAEENKNNKDKLSYKFTVIGNDGFVFLIDKD